MLFWLLSLVCLASAQPEVEWGYYNTPGLTTTAYGYYANLTWVPGASSAPYDTPISPLDLYVYFVGQYTVRVKVTPPSSLRWEIPGIIGAPPATAYAWRNYTVTSTNDPFTLTITRTPDMQTLFNSTYLYYSDRYLQWGTTLDPMSNIYGLGERNWTFRFDSIVTDTFSFISSDQGGTPGKVPLYGSHPYYINMVSGKAYGSLLFNSNAMDVVLGNSTLTYRTTGGILDLFVFGGPTPTAVTQQYHQTIGTSRLPPLWALGYHQSRWGYADYTWLQDVIDQMDNNSVPVDTFWVDIDYMDGWRVWTTNATLWPRQALGDIVRSLRDTGRYFIPIIDPGVKLDFNGYDVLTDGLNRNCFVRNPFGDQYEMGKVWPGRTYFPDWTHPNTSDYWEYWTRNFSIDIPISGVWIDMNEVASFCDGRCIMDPSEDDTYAYDYSLFQCNCSQRMNTSQWDDPPWIPLAVQQRPPRASSPPSFNGLDVSTMSFGAMHYLSREYNLHNLYGHFEGIVSYNIMRNIRGTRPFVVSRSTFPGDGRYVSHWLGDNNSDWKDLRTNIIGMLTMNLFGIAMIGADICGFSQNTTAELCQRWMQLGAFNTFFRNHNQQNMISQEPYAFGPEVLASNIKALNLRYCLNPYLYTQLAQVEMYGGSVLRPLFYDFPDQTNTYFMEEQFMVGPALLVSPVLYPNQTTVSAWFPPNNNWYDFFTGALVIDEFTTERTLELDTPLDHIQVHVKGGSIFLTQTPALNMAMQKGNPYQLNIALTSIRPGNTHCHCSNFTVDVPLLTLSCDPCVTLGSCGQCCAQAQAIANDPCALQWTTNPTMTGGAQYRAAMQQVIDACSITFNTECEQPQTANGMHFFDDGDTVDTIPNKQYSIISFVCTEDGDDYVINAYPDATGYPINATIDELRFYGQALSACPDACLEATVNYMHHSHWLGNARATDKRNGTTSYVWKDISIPIGEQWNILVECGCDNGGGLGNTAIALIVVFSVLGTAIIVFCICKMKRKDGDGGSIRLVDADERSKRYSQQQDAE